MDRSRLKPGSTADVSSRTAAGSTRAALALVLAASLLPLQSCALHMDEAAGVAKCDGCEPTVPIVDALVLSEDQLNDLKALGVYETSNLEDLINYQPMPARNALAGTPGSASYGLLQAVPIAIIALLGTGTFIAVAPHSARPSLGTLELPSREEVTEFLVGDDPTAPAFALWASANVLAQMLQDGLTPSNDLGRALQSQARAQVQRTQESLIAQMQAANDNDELPELGVRVASSQVVHMREYGDCETLVSHPRGRVELAKPCEANPARYCAEVQFCFGADQRAHLSASTVTAAEGSLPIDVTLRYLPSPRATPAHVTARSFVDPAGIRNPDAPASQWIGTILPGSGAQVPIDQAGLITINHPIAPGFANATHLGVVRLPPRHLERLHIRNFRRALDPS